MRVEHHGHQDDEIAEQYGADGLPPVHAAGDQSGGQHAGGDADARIGLGTPLQPSRLPPGGYRVRHSALHSADCGEKAVVSEQIGFAG